MGVRVYFQRRQTRFPLGGATTINTTYYISFDSPQQFVGPLGTLAGEFSWASTHMFWCQACGAAVNEFYSFWWLACAAVNEFYS